MWPLNSLLSSRLTQNSLCWDFHDCLRILALHRPGPTSGPGQEVIDRKLLRWFWIYLDVLKQKEGEESFEIKHALSCGGGGGALITRGLYQIGISSNSSTWTPAWEGLWALEPHWQWACYNSWKLLPFQVSEKIYLLLWWRILLMSVWSVLLSLHQSLAHFLLTKIKINGVSEDVSNLFPLVFQYAFMAFLFLFTYF